MRQVDVTRITAIFEKVEAERLFEPGEPIQLSGQRIEVNTRIENVELRKLPPPLGTQVAIHFVFTCRYPASIGLIRLIGHAFYLDTPSKMREAVETWRKRHRLPEQIEPYVINTILGRATVEAVGLSKILQIPPPIPLPGFTPKATRKKPGDTDFSHYV